MNRFTVARMLFAVTATSVCLALTVPSVADLRWLVFEQQLIARAMPLALGLAVAGILLTLRRQDLPAVVVLTLAAYLGYCVSSAVSMTTKGPRYDLAEAFNVTLSSTFCAWLLFRTVTHGKMCAIAAWSIGLRLWRKIPKARCEGGDC